MNTHPLFGPAIPSSPDLLIPATSPARPLQLVVDFSHLRPSGENGGVKPFFFELMRWLGRQTTVPLRITYLTVSNSHNDVRELLRPGDRLCCVRHDPNHPVRIPSWRTAELSVIEPPLDLVRRLQADVLYCPFGSVEMHCPGIPTVAFVADLLHRDYPHTLSQEAIANRESVVSEIVRVADVIQCNSQFVIDRMSQHYGYAHDRMFYTYNAIHGRLHRSAPGSPPSGLPARPFLFYPANTWVHKNHEVLLVAYRSYCAQAGSDAWPLVLTAHPDDRMKELASYARALGLGDDVFFLGHLKDRDFEEVWRRAGILVFPSLHEGFGIPPIEAMFMGVPIISSPDCSLSEVVGDAALFVDPRRPDLWAAAMQQLTTDASLRRRLIARGLLRLKVFNFATESRKLLDAFVQVTATNRKPLHRGIYPDRWTGPSFMLGLPGGGKPQSVVVECLPMPASRCIRFYKDSYPCGTFSLPANQVNTVRVTLDPSPGPLTIEVTDAANLNPADLRTHGILAGRIEVQTGDTTVLLHPSP